VISDRSEWNGDKPLILLILTRAQTCEGKRTFIKNLKEHEKEESRILCAKNHEDGTRARVQRLVR
jgi:hypothetical protein